MTATISTDVNLDLVLQRADRRYAEQHCGEAAEPGYLAALANAVQAQLVDQPTVPAPRVDEDAQRRAEMAGHLAERIEVLERDNAHLERDNARLADEVQHARGELEQERGRAAELGEQHAAALAENVELVDRLDAARGEREQMAGELDELRREVETLRKRTRQAQAPRPRPAPHRHCYPWLGETGAYGPCECDKPYPRAFDDGEEVAPDVEPLDALFARIRGGLADGDAA